MDLLEAPVLPVVGRRSFAALSFHRLLELSRPLCIALRVWCHDGNRQAAAGALLFSPVRDLLMPRAVGKQARSSSSGCCNEQHCWRRWWQQRRGTSG